MAQNDRLTGLVGNAGMKVPVRVATTANITLSGLQTIDGVVVVQDDRVLVKSQTSSVDNGIYVADTGTWERARDADGSYDFVTGSVVKVNEGTVGSGFWYCSSANPVDVGTDNLTFALSSSVLAVISAYAQTLLDDTTAAQARTTLDVPSNAEAILDTIVDAKGDLITGTAADTVARKAVGSNCQVLVANSNDASGLSYVSALNKAIYGMTYANAAGDVTNDLDIAAGGCADSTGAYWITTSALTKQLDAAWVVGNGVGGLDTGVIGNSDYYIWAIARPDTGVTDYLYSLSSTAPTMPANYTVKRLMGFFKRVAGSIVLFHTYETEGGGIEQNWDAPTLDINLANTLTTARRTDPVKVPLLFSVIAIIQVIVSDASANALAWICCPDQTDAAPSVTAAPLSTLFNVTGAVPAGTGLMRIRTSAAGLIAARSHLATVDLYAVSTMGFIWARRN